MTIDLLRVLDDGTDVAPAHPRRLSVGSESFAVEADDAGGTARPWVVGPGIRVSASGRR